MERTYIMIKPDGVQRNLVGEIIARFEKKGYKLAALKVCTPSLLLKTPPLQTQSADSGSLHDKAEESVANFGGMTPLLIDPNCCKQCGREVGPVPGWRDNSMSVSLPSAIGQRFAIITSCVADE